LGKFVQWASLISNQFIENLVEFEEVSVQVYLLFSSIPLQKNSIIM